MRIDATPLDKGARVVDAVFPMTKPETNLAAAALTARDEAANITVHVVESLDEPTAPEDDEAWIDEVTGQVAALWSGQRAGVSFAATMASAETRGRSRRR